MLSHSSQEFLKLLPYWGYPAMLFLMIIEGPIVTIISAFLASMGYFNIFAVFSLSVSGDVIGDAILYSVGFWGGKRILGKAQKLLKISSMTRERLERRFHENSSRIIFYVKSTTGLSYITFITAGALRMKISKFITFSILGGLVWSTLLVVAGYFFGYAADRISQYIKYAGLLIFSLAIIFFVVLTLYKRKQAREILE